MRRFGVQRQQSALGEGNPEADEGNLFEPLSNQSQAIMAVLESVVGA